MCATHVTRPNRPTAYREISQLADCHVSAAIGIGSSGTKPGLIPPLDPFFILLRAQSLPPQPLFAPDSYPDHEIAICSQIRSRPLPSQSSSLRLLGRGLTREYQVVSAVSASAIRGSSDLFAVRISVMEQGRLTEDEVNCIFCELIAGRGEKSVIYEDDVCLVIPTTGPVTSGHSMVIPKTHAPYLRDLDDATWSHVCVVAKRLERAIATSGIRGEGTNVFLADGEAAFQEIFHVHLHVFPRYRGDPFRIDADWTIKPSRAELNEVASRIRNAYESLDA
jgi:histidine triad (HIT) family protein